VLVVQSGESCPPAPIFERSNQMLIETEFQTNIITLSFKSTGKRIRLTKEETKEFNARMTKIIKEGK